MTVHPLPIQQYWEAIATIKSHPSDCQHQR